jgi:hypothetical protein
MSVKIVGAVSGVEADTNATSKALNVILYDSNNNPLQPTKTYSGIVLINVRQSAATAAGAVVWGLYNANATKIVHVESILLQMFFDGVAVATNMRYELLKMTGITAFSGGAAVTPSHKITSQSGAQVSAARVLDTGLTTTGGVAQAAFWNGLMGRVTQTATNFQSTQFNIPVASAAGALAGINWQLAQNEALVLRQLVTSVIGDNVVGAVEFNEQ